MTQPQRNPATGLSLAPGLARPKFAVLTPANNGSGGLLLFKFANAVGLHVPQTMKCQLPLCFHMGMLFTHKQQEGGPK